MSKPIIYYSQNKEDLILASVFKDKKKGFYVDVGANHPTKDSVTKIFYQRGWKGINIEPIPRLFKLLEADRPRDINLNIGISHQTGELSLRDYINGDGLSTFSDQMKQDYEKTRYWAAATYEDYTVKVFKLENICYEYNIKKIDFMKIDVEGYEFEVIKSNDWKKYRPLVLCIEANHIKNDWHSFLSKLSYSIFFNDGLNNYYYDKLAWPDFNYSYPDDFVMHYSDSMHYSQYSVLTENIRKAKYNQLIAEQSIYNDTYRQVTYGPKESLRQFVKSLDTKLIEISSINDKVRDIKKKKPSTEIKKTLQKAYIHDNSTGKLKAVISTIYISLRPLLVKLKP